MAKLIEFPHPALTGSYVFQESVHEHPSVTAACDLFGFAKTEKRSAPVVPIVPREPQWRGILEVVKSWGITIEESPGGVA
jgi:hypothetical protein